jgi:hypothetical protein
MIKYNLLWLCCVLAFAKAELSTAQSNQKIEKEEKINATDFPENAMKIVQELGYDRKKIKFYRETDGDKSSFEAKLTYKKRKYSVEFDDSGQLEDVEIDLKKRKVPEYTLAKINKTLDTVARKYRIEKVQEQYLPIDPSLSKLKERIANNKPDNYEMIVAFKEDRKIYRKEYLFDNNGVFISVRLIKRLDYDFLLF